jgi:hypothetical protein
MRQLIMLFLPSSMFFWWMTYYFMIKRPKIFVRVSRIIFHNIIIILFLPFVVLITFNYDDSYGFSGIRIVTIIIWSFVSCLILRSKG